MTSYSGPLPPAEDLARYEAILPGLADRIVAMAEGNAGHRQHLEKTVVEGNVAAQRRGQWFAFILAALVLLLGCWLVATDRTNLGLWLMLGDIIALAGVFVTGRVLQLKERRDRRQEELQRGGRG